MVQFIHGYISISHDIPMIFPGFHHDCYLNPHYVFNGFSWDDNNNNP